MKALVAPFKKEINFMLAIAIFLVSLYYLSPILPPFVAAFIIAYVGDPLVNRLEKWGLSRVFSATLVFLFFLMLVIMFLLLFVPLLERQVILLYNKLPDFFNWLQVSFVPWVNQHFGLNEALPIDYIKKAVTDNFQQTSTLAMTVWKTVSHSGVVIVQGLMTCLLVPVVTFYLLRDWNSVWKSLALYLPESTRPNVRTFVKEANDVLGAFLRGQFIVMLSLGLIYSVGLWLAGLQFALLVGLISGLINIVPYLGLIVGMTTACVMMYMQYHDWIHVLYAVIVFVVGSGLDNVFLTPNLIGDRIGLHPIAVIFAVLAGGHLFGVVGILLALPVASIIMVLLRHVRSSYEF